MLNCIQKCKMSLVNLYVVSLIVTVALICLQTWHLNIRNLLYQSNTYKTTWNIRYVDTDAISLQTETTTTPMNLTMRRMSPDWMQTGILFQFPQWNVSILSAVGRNGTRGGTWDQIILNGWEGRLNVNDTYRCCLYYADGGYEQVLVSHKNHWLQCKKVPRIATQITCPNVRCGLGHSPIGVSLVPNIKQCSNDSKSSMPITYPLRQENNSIGLCSKIAYGSLSANTLIEWYEIQKRMGVSKVITFTHNLTEKALLVLQHYHEMGFVDMYPFQYPDTDRLPRRVGDKSAQVFNDEQVAAFDCMEKLAGYQFVGILDLDEFLIPTKAGVPSWHNLFKILLRQNPQASGFSFRTEVFVKEWRNGSTANQFSVTQFLNRTRPIWDRPKNIFLPGRVVPGSVWTHNYTDAPGYKKVDVGSGYATLKHFRSCRKEWLKNNNCFRRRRYRDQRLLRLVSQINETIQTVQRKVHL